MKKQATEVKDTAMESAGQVVEVAKEEAAHVALHAADQVRDLFDQARSELASQAGNQQHRLATSLHSWAKELGAMAANSDESGPVTDLAQRAARQGGAVAHWLENHEPVEVLEEVKAFARRRPVAFLALAAAAGIMVGRLTRSAVAANTEVDSATPVGLAPTPGPRTATMSSTTPTVTPYSSVPPSPVPDSTRSAFTSTPYTNTSVQDDGAGSRAEASGENGATASGQPAAIADPGDLYAQVRPSDVHR